MSGSTPFVAISSINGTVDVVIRQYQQQQQTDYNFVDIIMNQGQLSGLMYTFKSIERQFIEDQTVKLMNEAVQQTTLGAYVEMPYDPEKPEVHSILGQLKPAEESKRKNPKAKNIKDPALQKFIIYCK